MKFLGVIAITYFVMLSGYSEAGILTPDGKEVADRSCSECHGMSGLHAGHTTPSPSATPSFSQIAARPEINRQFLERFFDRIIVMPIYQLSASEKSAVIDYILSLQQPSRR